MPLDERAGARYRSPMAENPVPREDPAQTKRDIRAAIVFGVVAATIEMGILLYFVFRPPPVDAEKAYLVQAEQRREAASRPVGGSGMYR